MTTPNLRQIARAILWSCVGFNAGLLAFDLRHGFLLTATLHAILVTVLMVWLHLRRRFDDWIDAQVRKAVAERDIAEGVLQDLQRMKRAGYQIHVDGEIGVSTRH